MDLWDFNYRAWAATGVYMSIVHVGATGHESAYGHCGVAV